ncbi:type II toxin-antitoxin system RelB/DinJ family antitoxin [Candidatus Palauibacter sp.]|uniref:type II toxin-antitoxin system RelB/DinJ family antitoxin n=1 Tax=Candidatus Palauibacter sp. TaxID=3101350 RepID=UPI003B022805
MSTDTVVRARIDSDTKARATEALQAMGLTVSDAIRLLLLRVADEKRLPFAVQVPNPSTLEAMKELDEGKGQRFASAEELFRDLDESRPSSGTETIRRQPGPDGGR